MAQDTDTTTDERSGPGVFRWAGHPSPRPIRIAGTRHVVRHPDAPPMTIDDAGEKVDVPDVVTIDDPELATRMRASSNWSEVDVADLFAAELVEIDGISDELARKVAGSVDREDLLADIAAGGQRATDAATRLQKVDGIGKATASAIFDHFTPDDPATTDAGDAGDDTEES